MTEDLDPIACIRVKSVEGQLPLFLLQRNLDKFSVRGVALEILFEVAAGVVGNLFAGGRVEVIDQFGHLDMAVEAGLKTQHRMVDAAQPG